MSNKLTREHGISLGRLPEYQGKFDPTASESKEAKIFITASVRFIMGKYSYRMNGAITSVRSREISITTLTTCFKTLWRIGYKLNNIKNFHGGHVESLARHFWAFGATPKYLSTIFTQLRKLNDWLNKPDLVKNIEYYFKDIDPSEFKVKTVALSSKSWSGNDVDIIEVIKMADLEDERFGLMLRMIWVFGLRTSEVLQINPSLDDNGMYLNIRPGVAKGGRPRIIPIENTVQREVLNYVKSKIGANDFMGWEGLASKHDSLLKKNKKRFLNYMQKIGITKKQMGVTAHGLRAEYAENMALSLGMVPATLGGSSNQLNKGELNIIRKGVSERLGHSRLEVTASYYGSLRKKSDGLGQFIGSLSFKNESAYVVNIFANPPFKKRKDQYVKMNELQTHRNHRITLSFNQVTDDHVMEVKQNLTILELQKDSQYDSLVEKIRIVLANYGASI